MKNRIKDKIKIIAGYYIAGFILILFSMSVLAAFGCLVFGFMSLSWLAFAKCLLRAILFSSVAICLMASFILIDYKLLSRKLGIKMKLYSDEAMQPSIHNGGIYGKHFCCPVCGDRGVSALSCAKLGGRYSVLLYDSCRECGQKLYWAKTDLSAVYN